MHDTFFKLFAQDNILYDLYEKYGLPAPRVKASGFWALVRIINAQLISTTAADTILKRLDTVLPDHTAQAWQDTDTQRIRACGLSQTKLYALNAIADDIIQGTLNLDTLSAQSPHTIHQVLTVYKGIGNWTANAYALMHHPDVFLYDDLGIRDGMQILLQRDSRPTSAFCSAHYQQHWKPYGTAATYFIWHIKNTVKLG